MKLQKIIAMSLTASLLAGMCCGCSKTAEPEAADSSVTVDEITVTMEDLTPNTIGTESENAYQVTLKNSTGQDIKAISVTDSESEESSGNLLEKGDLFLDGEERIFYYEPSSATEVTQENADEKMTYGGCDLNIILADKSKYTLHGFPFEELVELGVEGAIVVEEFEAEKISGTVAFLSYDNISMKDSEVAILETEEEERIAAEEEAKKKAEEEAAAKAAAAAAAQKKAASSSSSKKKKSSSQSSESCIGDAGLTY